MRAVTGPSQLRRFLLLLAVCEGQVPCVCFQCCVKLYKINKSKDSPFLLESRSGDLRDRGSVENPGRVTTPICTPGREGVIFLISRREKQQRFAQLKDIIR